MEELEKLNEEQRGPVFDTEGAVLVLAGAGSGKTRVLTARIAYLIEEKRVSPQNILAITFTNKAANEMKERLLSMTEINGAWVCTIHSMCVKMLRAFAQKRGLEENFSIYSEQERTAVIKQVCRELGYDEEGALKSAKYHISALKMLGVPPEEYEKMHGRERNIKEAMQVFYRYNARLRKNNALDFDDLLTEARALLSSDREAREYFAQKFRYIHVDEFQDTNSVQFDIIKLLASVHGNLFVVGDDDQSIYGWRGADIGNILHFERSFPKAKVYKLQRNYRSTQAILSLANASIAHNRSRKGKTLWTDNAAGEKPVYYEAEGEAEEALYCSRIISELRRAGYKLSDFAVLMRINALTRSFEQEFTKYGLSYKVFGGFKFFERKEIKDILAYLRLISNPFDSEAAARVINVPRRGIGDKTVQTLNAYAEAEGLSLYDAVLDCDLLSLNAGTREKVRSFAACVKDLVVKSQELRLDELVSYLVDSLDMRGAYRDGTDEGEAKVANIDEFINSVQEFVRMNEGATLDEYLQQITLYSDTDEMDEGDYVTIATIHAVKGLEFRCVFLVGLEEGIIPTPRALDEPEGIEEERRLMYVAITRAKEKLFLTCTRQRYLYGKREPTARSQFVEELEKELSLPQRAPRGFGGYETPYRYNQGYGGSGYGGGGYRESRYVGRASAQGYGRNEGTGGSFGGAGKPPAPPARAPYGSVPATRAPSGGEEKDVSRFEVGTRVRHVRFGQGVIAAVRGSGRNLIVTVRFDQVGNKDLAAALAPLEIIGG